MRAVVIFIASGAYAGYAPWAPGTAGAALGLILGWLLFAPIWEYAPAAFVMLFGVIFGGSCVIAGSAEKIFGSHDSPCIVIDEILGMIAAMFLVPAGWAWMGACFALFRFFDIIKPWPANRLDRVDGGAGVMLDDLAAGIYANVVLQIVRRVI
jgi:phosphatidylglycerophosphatase A